MYSPEEKIKLFAISSRVAVFVLQFVANYLIDDHQPKVFRKPVTEQNASFTGRPLFDMATRGLTHWDAEYFLHIAEYGYTYENTVAFFPLFPLSARFLGNIFHIVLNYTFYVTNLPFFLTKHCSLVLMALILNYVLFVHTALTLYKLGLKVTYNQQLSYMAALLFCVNPASIFFSAAYSETLFCFLSFNAMLCIESENLVTGSLLCGLSAVTRSNGLINIGYIFYHILKTRRSLLSFILSVAVLFCCLAIATLPFMVYQFYCYTKFCLHTEHYLPDFLVEHARINHYILPVGKSSWCDDNIPFAYNYVQNHYWQVGFLKYFEWKQLPNFVLAGPILVLTFYGLYKFIVTHKWNLMYLGLLKGKDKPFPTSCFPYFAHNGFLAVFGLLFMHVQVSTRLICAACPAFYWMCAEIVVPDMAETKEAVAAKKVSAKFDSFFEPAANVRSKWKTVLITERFFRRGLLIRYYYFAYFLAGPVIFSNNLPWT